MDADQVRSGRSSFKFQGSELNDISNTEQGMMNVEVSNLLWYSAFPVFVYKLL